MNLSRRELLRLGGVGFVGGIGGAIIDSELPVLRGRVSLVVGNEDTEPHHISVVILREETSEYSTATVFEEGYGLDPHEEERNDSTDWYAIEPNALHRRPYRILVKVGGGQTHHYHFRPDCSKKAHEFADEPITDGMYIYVNQEGDPIFSQNTCDGNDWLV